MEFTYKIYPNEALILETVSGVITIEEFVRKAEALFADPAFSPKYSGLVDLRGTTSRLSKVELYGFANYMNQSELFGKAPWAALADDPIVVALGQIFRNRMIDDQLFGVFSTVGAAADFLKKPALNQLCE